MKIAILGSFDFHLECIGFLLEIYKGVETDIYLKNNSDKFNAIDFYSSLFDFNIIYNKFSIDIINNYDKIFKLTSNDYCLDHSKIVSILHLNGIKQLKCKSEKYICLTPYIQGKNIHYTFPVYRPNLSYTKISKTVTMIGHYKNENFDHDTINFIKQNSKYHFNFIIWGSVNYPNLDNIENITILSNVKTVTMDKIIKESKFILSKKKIQYDRFSGQLALSISYEKPLIVDIKTKDTYQLPGIVFNKNYNEIGILDDINNEKYNNIIEDIKQLKENMINRNKYIFNLEF